MELDPRTTALVAVHLQGDIIGADGAFAGFFAEQVRARDVVAVNAGLLHAVRAAGGMVVYTRVAYRPGYPDLVANSPLLTLVPQFGCLVDGSPQAEIVPEVAPTEGDTVLTHQRVGGFTGSGLHESLQERGIGTVLLSGVASNASVESTARTASDLGYRTVLVEDACSAATLEAHQATVASLGLLGEITTAAEVRAALGS